MTHKANIIKELEINANINYDEIKKRYPDIKNKHFINVRWEWRKSLKQKKKGKRTKKGKKTISTSSSKTKGGMSTAPPQQTYTKIDDDTIEMAILRRLNSGQITDMLIGRMIEFYYKIRGKEDKIKDDIDMEEFRLIGKALKDSG